MTTKVDAYLARAVRWRKEAERLRAVLLSCKLEETLKWGKPCYQIDGKNIAIIQPMKAFLALLFFKGALLEDPNGILQKQGDNTQSALRICFTSVAEVAQTKAAVKDLVRQAIEVERAGKTVPKKRAKVVLVEELRTRLQEDRKLKAAFEALTPGRQRGYNIYFSGAKRSQTRADRVEKCVPAILAGKGLRDR